MIWKQFPFFLIIKSHINFVFIFCHVNFAILLLLLLLLLPFLCSLLFADPLRDDTSSISVVLFVSRPIKIDVSLKLLSRLWLLLLLLLLWIIWGLLLLLLWLLLLLLLLFWLSFVSIESSWSGCSTTFFLFRVLLAGLPVALLFGDLYSPVVSFGDWGDRLL